MSSPKKSRKKPNKGKAKVKSAKLTTSSSKKRKATAHPRNRGISLSSHKDRFLNEEKEAEYKRPRSPLSPLREWIHKSSSSTKKKTSKKSTKKASTKKKNTIKVPNRRPRSASNPSINAYSSNKYGQNRKKSDPLKPKTPKNTDSNYKRKRRKTPPNLEQKQLKFTKKNNKITVATSPKKNRNKKQTFVQRSSLKAKNALHIVKAPPKGSQRSKSTKRGSFFSSLSRREKKEKPKTRSKSIKGHNRHKSIKDKIHEFTKTISRPTEAKDSNKHKTFNVNINKSQEKRSSLNMHKMRMIKAFREEQTDDEITDESSSLEIVKLKHQNGRHHKRGSSGIPSFFQKKLQFEFGQYLDEKARIFIAYCMRIYTLRITENVFELISQYHVMPFDSGFICMTSKDDDEYSCFTSISYHYPLIQLPAASMPTVLNGIRDDRLDSIISYERQYSDHQSPQSMPLPNTKNVYSLSCEVKQFSPQKKRIKRMKPNTSVTKSRSVERLSLTQSESVVTPVIGDGAFCEDIEVIKEDVIKKYKKKIYKKRQKDNEKKKGNRSNPYLPRSGSFDRERQREIKNRLFYSSAPELSEDETIDDRDTDLSAEADDGFPDINYSQLLHYKHRFEEETMSEQSKSLTNDRDIQRLFKNTPVLNEDTPTLTSLNEDMYDDYNDIHPPQSPSGNDTDTTTPTLSERPFFGKEFRITFDEDETQIHKVKNKWNATTNGDNGVGIAEWTLLSTPKVFDFYKGKNINEAQRVSGLGISAGLGIGGFVDRTRGVCGVSLAPIYYQYGGMDKDERYYSNLDICNLYTGDYMRCVHKLPFNNLYDTASSIVRSGYQSTLVISGGQYYGRDIFDDNIIQAKTYLYAPWVNSLYHNSLENDAFIDKHGIINNRTSANNKKRRKSIDIPKSPVPAPSTPTFPAQTSSNKATKPRKRTSSKQFKTRKRTSSNQFAILDFDNILTRPTSRSISHAYRPSEHTLASSGVDLPPTITEENDPWINGPSLITRRANHGSISWDEHIVFCCGGFGSSGRRINNVEMLRMDKFTSIHDLNKLRWKKCSSMSANKSNLVLIHWKPKTCIVSVGSGSKVVESYDPYKDNWKDLPPLNTHQISNKSCRFYYDLHHQTNCLMFLKFRNGIIKSMEYLDERIKVKRWTPINDQYISLFNAQFINNINYLQNIKSFCFA